jgi:hypothetical protein
MRGWGRLLALAAGTACALGFLVVPFAGAQAAQASCELRDVTREEGTDVTLPEPEPGEPLAPSLGGTDFDFILACQVPADVRFELDVVAENGSATRDQDYGIGSVHVVTGPFATPQNLETPITVGVLADPYVEPDETFTLRLTTNDTTVELTKGTALGTIVNDDDGAPCLLLSETAVGVAAPFSTPIDRRFAGPVPRLSAANCGGTDVNVLAHGTDASGAGATWELTNASSGGNIDSTCDLGLDLFRAAVTVWKSGGGGVGTVLTQDDAAMVGDDGLSPLVLAPVTAREISPDVEMPCEGSGGLDQPMTMTIVLTAVAP